MSKTGLATVKTGQGLLPQKSRTVCFLTTLIMLFFNACTLFNNEAVAGEKTGNGTQAGILRSGVQLSDTDGNTLFGNGGCMLQVVRHKRNGDDIDYSTIDSVSPYIYWYGEYRYSSGNALGVSCYRTTDMVNWEFRGNILPESVSVELETDGFFLERPKVIYNEKTGKYCLWAHREGTGWNYGYASVLVAYGDSPDGEFTYYKTFRPFDDPALDVHDSGYTGDYSDDDLPYGYMSRDCTLFVDDDGTAYFASSSSENTAINIYRLTDDYLDVDTSWLCQDALKYNQKEAPCIIKRNGVYYCVTSDTDGWNVTPSRWFYSTAIGGPWYYGGVFSDNDDTSSNSSNDRHSDRSQPAYIFKLTGTNASHKTSWLYLGDRWGPAHGGSSTYDNEEVLMKIEFDDTTLTTTYNSSGPAVPLCNAFFSEALVPDVANGEIGYPQYFYIKNANDQYLTNLEYCYTGTNASWTSTEPSSVTSGSGTSKRYRLQYRYQYRCVPTNYGYMLVNRYSGYAIASNGTGENGTCSMQTRDAGDEKQSFTLEVYDSNYYKLKNYATEQYVSTWLKTTKAENIQLNGSNILWMTSYGYYPGWVGSEQTYRDYYTATKIRQRWQFIPVNTADDEWDFE
ncbi:MAG: hypothetical protein K6G80_02145 [Treponema sp.]|nr:hypothetical protein [Treponema sp.]